MRLIRLMKVYKCGGKACGREVHIKDSIYRLCMCRATFLSLCRTKLMVCQHVVMNHACINPYIHTASIIQGKQQSLSFIELNFCRYTGRVSNFVSEISTC